MNSVKDREVRYFTTSIYTNFLMLAIPVLPGIVAYIAAERLLTFGNPILRELAPVGIGLACLLVCSPLTCRITDWIRGAN